MPKNNNIQFKEIECDNHSNTLINHSTNFNLTQKEINDVTNIENLKEHQNKMATTSNKKFNSLLIKRLNAKIWSPIFQKGKKFLLQMQKKRDKIKGIL